jgi:hypothetical protein
MEYEDNAKSKSISVLLFSTLDGDFRICAFCGRHKPTLQHVQNGVWVFFVFLRNLIFFALATCGFRRFVRPETLGLVKLCHKILLSAVFAYTYLLFNPWRALSTSNAGTEIDCPNGYAYRLPNDEYIACEDFDLYHAEQFHGRIRKDLYLRGAK